MSNAPTSSMSKLEVYEAYQSGNISEAEAQEFFGDEWEDVCQLSRVEGILTRQSEPDVRSDDLYR